MQSWLPLLLVGTPRLYGAWHHVMTGMLQHGGLADNVTDHRLNTRTVLMNPISRFIYWNMNYHIEHHMYPKVPYYALPALHQLVHHDLPSPSPSIFAAFIEMWPVLVRQLHNEDYFEAETARECDTLSRVVVSGLKGQPAATKQCKNTN